jgi:HKD family nuclease
VDADSILLDCREDDSDDGFEAGWEHKATDLANRTPCVIVPPACTGGSESKVGVGFAACDPRGEREDRATFRLPCNGGRGWKSEGYSLETNMAARAVALPKNEQNRTRLVSNGSPNDHHKALEELLGTATSISIAVAFLKVKGLEKIAPLLEARLKVKANFDIFVGRDFCLTEPAALESLEKLSKRYRSLRVFAAKPDARSTFHSKLYLGVGPAKAILLVGSANLTGGALTTNHEISVLSTLDLSDALILQIQSVFVGYLGSDRFEALDPVVLAQYRLLFKKAQDARRRIEREIAASTASLFDLARLTALHAEFVESREETKALHKRQRDREAANAVQREIAKMAELPKLSLGDQDAFQTRFRNLITSGDGHDHLWHSGDIHRRGQAALKHPKKTIAFFALAETAARLPVEEGYAKLRKSAGDTEGVGINMVSEILCTFAPARYAVFNGNTAKALRVIGADPPNAGSLFSPAAYARVCGIIGAVQERIGGKDLSDTDAFLNWIYQMKVKKVA